MLVTATVTMLLTRIMLIILSVLFIQHVEAGSKGTVVITVSEEDEYMKPSGSGDLGYGSGISQDEISPCCTTGNCTCDSFLHVLVSLTDNVMVYITTDVVLSSIVPIVGVENITILGYNNPTVYCNDNGGVKVSSCNNIIVEGIVWKNCGSINNPVLAMHKMSNIAIENCTFQQSRGQAISLANIKGDVYINKCMFVHNNHHRGDGASIYYSSQYSQVHFKIHNCKFSDNGIAKSVVYIKGLQKMNDPVSLMNSEFTNNNGVPVYIIKENIHIHGKVLFKGNTAMEGGGIYSSYSNVVFDEQSNGTFYHNNATNGGGIYSSYSNVVFDEQSNVTFDHNNSTDGGGIFSSQSKIVFDGNSTVKFTANDATQHGGAIWAQYNSVISFKGSSIIMFSYNNATEYGGAIYNNYYGKTSFEESTTVTFINNTAYKHGGAIRSLRDSTVLFKGNSTVRFIGNSAVLYHGGAVYSAERSDMHFKEDCKVEFAENKVGWVGGAIFFYNYNALPRVTVSFEGKSAIIFTNNIAKRAGAMYGRKCDILVTEHSSLTFTNNNAIWEGGAIYTEDESTAVFEGTSTMTFTSNRATTSGGAIYSENQLRIVFKGNTYLMFNNNEAGESGGAIYSTTNSRVVCKGNSMVQFTNNTALFGGAMHSYNCNVSFAGNSSTTFTGNTATQKGGTVYIDNSDLLLNETSTLKFINNKALNQGGAIYSTTGSDISFVGHTSLLPSSSSSYFINNTAEYGGAVFISGSSMKFGHYSTAIFDGNAALQNGGAVYISDQCSTTFSNYSNITFSNNLAERYGGALYLKLAQKTVKYSSKASTKFHNNYARIAGYSLYVSVTKSCNSSCLNDSISGIREDLQQNIQFSKEIAATPNKLELYHPAICIDGYDADQNCEVYYLNNIMLGEEITLDACVFDYYNQPSNAAQFKVTGEDDPNYQVDGIHDILVSCGSNAFQGVRITGNKSLSVASYNYTLTIAFHVGPTSEEGSFSSMLIVALSPCHPGFWHYKKSQKCVCYGGNNIVFCSGTNSTIKRGYWFGSVNGQPTVAVCPVNYCDFSCCETTDGFYSLSPLRANQCRSHRSGPACGNCKEGLTLSFDSAECVKTEKCTTGQTVLVVILTVLYWIAVVVAVFIMMYFKVPIGYLYVITYYYSILDALLNQTLYLSQWLLTTFNTVASIFKITPQFLGQLCLVKGMSGIDQHFLHYVHPFAVSLILLTIILLARVSYRFSSFISRGIIHVICLLLLLSYTSVATTSLLLMRTLTFLDVDTIYTYLSPDIEYFHGRHLPYAIVAVLCTIVIVIGLPLLLLLEPFLNQRLNFTRFKPLLDQFQGCYKDKYRYFAAYYMICRLVIVIIIITTPSNNVLVQYILIGTCVIMAAVQVLLRPYQLKSLNTFDGIILLLTVLVSVIPVLDSSKTDVLVGITLFVVLLPLILFVTILLLMFKNNIRKMLAHCKPKNTEETLNNSDIPLAEFYVIVDEDSRRNATICSV